jgi:hypothetical protein
LTWFGSRSITVIAQRTASASWNAAKPPAWLTIALSPAQRDVVASLYSSAVWKSWPRIEPTRARTASSLLHPGLLGCFAMNSAIQVWPSLAACATSGAPSGSASNHQSLKHRLFHRDYSREIIPKRLLTPQRLFTPPCVHTRPHLVKPGLMVCHLGQRTTVTVHVCHVFTPGKKRQIYLLWSVGSARAM